MSTSRYPTDVLAAGFERANRKRASRDQVVRAGLVIEDPASGFCGAVLRWENGLVVLEDRRGRRRSFPLGPGFLLEGEPVTLKAPVRKGAEPTHTRSGSRVGPVEPARVALPSRIYVEGRHDAELVEKVWGDDLRHVGVVVEYMGGMDDLPAIVAEFAPCGGHRLGVLVDHLVPGSKESRIVEQVAAGPWGDDVLVTGHRYIDIWEAVKPARLGLREWPRIPRGTDWKHGVCAAMGWPHKDQADIARAWQFILSRVGNWNDLDPGLLREVERLIDFVTQDHLDRES
ncbi:DUF3097 domain-containing protein [Raineyella sp. W15-4]|uniref:DUF3097 domain-containing protein n=1 Tax=Raineyella sp. W15-4 TaxID=3081651 RepID=UPI0029555C26|nr:DUF3097 domain-containing protein [Raineyella sp. W15-4]WOQ15697.1 DUF3097 domain-containing protein [Raineyella sp. W15-4]